MVFVAVLLVAADLAADAEMFEESASLYKRATEICHAFGEHTLAGTDALALLSRAYLGLARADVARGYVDRALERYEIALKQMELCDLPRPDALEVQVRSELAALKPSDPKPWWRFW